MDDIKDKFKVELDSCIKKLGSIPKVEKEQKLGDLCSSNSKKRNNSMRKRNTYLEKEIKDMKKLEELLKFEKRKFSDL